MSAVLKLIDKQKGGPGTCKGPHYKAMFDSIKDVIVKTMISGQPNMLHLFKSYKSDDIENSMCFQILGFDVMFDQKLKCYLLEINQSPSFATDTPLDYEIKYAVIKESLYLLNLS